MGSSKKPQKWARQIENRGWTPEEFSDAIKKGKKFATPNHVNKSNTATRYEYIGRYIVRDDKTKEILQIGREDFERPRIGK